METYILNIISNNNCYKKNRKVKKKGTIMCWLGVGGSIGNIPCQHLDFCQAKYESTCVMDMLTFSF